MPVQGSKLRSQDSLLPACDRGAQHKSSEGAGATGKPLTGR